MKFAKKTQAFEKLTGVYIWDDDTRRNLTTLLEGELRKVRALFSDEELKTMYDIQYTLAKAEDYYGQEAEFLASETFDKFSRLNGGMQTALILLMLDICEPTGWAKYDHEVREAVKSAFTFSNILNPAFVDWNDDLYFVATGLNGSSFKTDRILEISRRRTLERGHSYSHFSGRVETCYDELKLHTPFPPGTLMLAFRRSEGGHLRLLNLGKGPLNPGLDDLPPANHFLSAAMIRKNGRFLKERGCHGILLYSDTFEHKYVALTHDGLSELEIIGRKSLGDPSPFVHVNHNTFEF